MITIFLKITYLKTMTNLIFGDERNASNRVSVKLICIAQNKILLIRAKGKDVFNLVGGGVDYWETLPETIKREFFEETWHQLASTIIPKLIHGEIKHFPRWWQFDWVVNIFYILSFPEQFNIILEEWVYEEFKWVAKNELKKLAVSDHTNKEVLLSFL